MSEIIETGVRCLQDEAQAILDLVTRLGADFEKAVDMIYHCKGKVIVTGVGKSGHVATKIAATLASTGTPSFFLNPLDAYHGDLGMIAPGDVVMALSYSGNTDELLRFLPLILERNIPIIGLSGNPQSLLARYSVCHLDIAVSHEADPLNLAPTSSTTATMAMGDALACALIQLRQFKAMDFAKFHPGGSLGKRLLGQVKDFMTTEPLPVARPNEMLSDTIITISQGKKGLVAVIDSQEHVVGIITDGDVRRAMQNHREAFFSLQLKDVMTNTPKTIRETATLSEAADLMLRNSIHSLLVLDETGRFIGIIDYFTCL